MEPSRQNILLVILHRFLYCIVMTQLEGNETNPTRYSTDFTGARRSHRRRSLATLLKIYAIEYDHNKTSKFLLCKKKFNAHGQTYPPPPPAMLPQTGF